MPSAGSVLDPKVIKELTQTANKANDFFQNLIDNKKFQEILGNLSVGEVRAWEALSSTGLATDVNVWLPRVSKWLDEGVEFVENGAKVIIRKGGDDVGEIVDDLLRVKYAGLGGDVVCEASKTTTVIGRWSGGTEDLWNTGLARQVDDVTGNPAGMNILGNVDNSPPPSEIWSNQNKPWLDAAIERDDVIRAVSEPMDIDNVFYVIPDDIPANAFSSPQSLSNYLTSLSDAEASQLGFYGREIRYLFQNGYSWDATTKVFIK